LCERRGKGGGDVLSFLYPTLLTASVPVPRRGSDTKRGRKVEGGVRLAPMSDTVSWLPPGCSVNCILETDGRPGDRGPGEGDDPSAEEGKGTRVPLVKSEGVRLLYAVIVKFPF